MGKSLSLDIHKRVFSLVEDGFSCHEAHRIGGGSTAGMAAYQQAGCGLEVSER
jgi:hypothetical protein